MMTKKQLSPQQQKKLLAIKRDKNLKANLERFVSQVKGFNYEEIRAKWNYLHKANSGVSIKRKHVGIQKTTVKPYVLEKGVVVTARGSMNDRISKMQALRPLLLRMKIRANTIPIYRADAVALREVLKNDSELSKLSFSTTAIKDNPTMVRVYRTA